MLNLRPSLRLGFHGRRTFLFLAVLWTLASSSVSPVSAQQGAAVRISGSVFDGGRPASGVEVSLSPVMDDYEGYRLRLGLGELWAHPVATSVTERDGRYGFEVPAGTRWRLIVEAFDRATVTRRLEPLYADREMEPVLLRPAVVMEVRVRAVDGRPVPGARVNASTGGYTRDQWPYSWTAAATDLTGRARLRVATTQPWLLEIVGRGQPPVDVEHSQGQVVDVGLSAASRLDLRLHLPSDEPAAGALVFRPGKGITLAMADSRGHALIFGTPRSRQEIQILTNDGHALKTSVDFPAPGLEAALDLLLQPPRRLDIVVTTAGGIEPVAGAVAWARDDRVEYGDARGRVSLTIPATERSIKLSVTAPGHLPWMEPRIALSAAEQAMTVGLEPAAVLRGRVIDAAGRPVEGAAVNVLPESDSRSGGRFRNFPEGWDGCTGPDGRFTLSPLPAAARLNLTAAKHGYAVGQLSIEPLSPRQERGGVELMLGTGKYAAGIVYDENSRPVADAVVELFPRDGDEASGRDALPGVTVSTGPDGRFELHSLGPKPFDVRVSASGFVSARVPGIQIEDTEIPGEPADLGTFFLEAATSLAGRVVDEDGRPVAGVKVDLAHPGARSYGRLDDAMRGRTDVEGRFLFVDRAPGAYELRIDEEGYLVAESGRVEAPHHEPVVLVLRRGATLRGRIADATGGVVAGATVTAYDRSADNRYFRTFSDESGVFELIGLATAEHQLYVKLEGFQSESRKVQILSDQEPQPIEVVMQRTVIVAGQVNWPDGRPIPDVSIRVKPAGDEEHGHPLGVTNDQGQFEIDEVSPGPSVIVATLGSFEVRRKLDVRAGQNLVSLTMPAGFEVSGWIIGDQGEPVSAAQVTLWPDHGFEPAWTSDDGAYTITDVAPGEYRIHVRHPDYSDFEDHETFELGAQSIVGLDVRLRRGAVVSGVVRGLDQDSLAAARVKLFRTAGEGRAGSYSAAPDYRGWFQMEHVGPGTYRAEAQIEGNTMAVGRFELPEGIGEAEVDLLPVDGVQVRGRVERGDEGLADAYVELRTEDRRSISSYTAGDGTFVLQRVPEGEYQLTVNESGAHHEIGIDVVEGVDVLVELPEGEVSGVVRNGETGEPVERAKIYLEGLGTPDAASEGWRSRTFRTIHTDSRGVFVARSIPVGALRLRAEHRDHGVGLAEVDVGQEPVRGVELALSRVEEVVLRLVWDDGVPVRAESASIAVLDPAGHLELATYEGVDAQGRVQVDSIPPGDWRIWIHTAPTYSFAESASAISRDSSVVGDFVEVPASAWHEVAVRIPTDGEIPVVLPKGAELSLTVPDLAIPGEFPKMIASLLDAEGRTLPGMSEVGGAILLSGGSARIPGLWPSVWTLVLHHPDGRSWHATVVTEAGQTTEVLLE